MVQYKVGSHAHTVAEEPQPLRDELWPGEVGEFVEGDKYDDEDGPEIFYYTNDDQEDAWDEEPAQSDLSDAAYLDPLALVNAWEGALRDLKEAHQERFLPPTEAPLSAIQKQHKAPFWYGPPSTEASTSKLAARIDESAPLESSTSSNRPANNSKLVTPVQDARANSKKRRLTGSQKKARKVAKLNAQGLKHSASNNKLQAVEREEHEDEYEAKLQPESSKTPVETRSIENIPRAGPSSPAFIGPSQTTAPPHVVTAPIFPAFPPAQSSGMRSPAGAASFFPVPPIASLPSRFPPPPSITPLTGTEAPLEPETPEQLLEAALWSWFTAGYQTALLHAAAGVARFAPSSSGDVAEQ